MLKLLLISQLAFVPVIDLFFETKNQESIQNISGFEVTGLSSTPVNTIPSQLNIPIDNKNAYYKQELDNGYSQIIAIANDSKQKSKWTYKKNKLEGEAITYYSNGNIAFKGNYKDNMPDGNWQFFDTTGTLYLQQSFNADQFHAVKRAVTTYNYKTKSTFPIVNDVVKEKSSIPTVLKRQKLFASPIVQNTMINWQYAFPHGEIKRYNSDGILVEHGEYKNGYKYGIWNSYNINGDLIESGPYIHNVKSGRWKNYNNGKVQKIETFKNGQSTYIKQFRS